MWSRRLAASLHILWPHTHTWLHVLLKSNYYRRIVFASVCENGLRRARRAVDSAAAQGTHTHTLYCNENVSVSTTSAANDHASPHVCAQKKPLYSEPIVSYRGMPKSVCARFRGHYAECDLHSTIGLVYTTVLSSSYSRIAGMLSTGAFFGVCVCVGLTVRQSPDVCAQIPRAYACVCACGTSPTSGDKYMALKVRVH